MISARVSTPSEFSAPDSAAKKESVPGIQLRPERWPDRVLTSEREGRSVAVGGAPEPTNLRWVTSRATLAKVLELRHPLAELRVASLWTSRWEETPTPTDPPHLTARLTQRRDQTTFLISR